LGNPKAVFIFTVTTLNHFIGGTATPVHPELTNPVTLKSFDAIEVLLTALALITVAR
jgi:hypothetical protein